MTADELVVPRSSAGGMTPPPSSPTDDELWSAFAESRDRRLRGRLVERYLPLVRSIARRYAGGAVPFDDLVQVASIGLLNAVDRFDPARGFAFSSFAFPTIAGEVRRYFRDRTWAVRPPRDLQERSLTVDRVAGQLTTRLGRAPTVRQIGQALELTDAEVVEAMEAGQASVAASLSAPRGGEDDVGETIGSSIGVDDEGFAMAEYRATYEHLSVCLTVRERRLVELRFGADLTQAEIGRCVGLSQMQVSRLLRRALAKLTAAAHPPDPEPPGSACPPSRPAHRAYTAWLEF
jgi:RNA polymerase sigma-B factor